MENIRWYQPSDNFDWKITLKKFFAGLGYTVIVAAIAYSIDYLQTATFPAKYAVYVGLIITILHALANVVKHWHD